jgi:hypothetical protein
MSDAPNTEFSYAKRLSLMHALLLTELRRPQDPPPSANLQDYPALDAASYIACFITFQAIRAAGRSPAEERLDQFEMLSVYQVYALLSYAFLAMPLEQQRIAPDLEQQQYVIGKTLFAELSDEELVDVIDSGQRKFNLISQADAEHWQQYRQDLEKAVIALVVASTDDETPYNKEELYPVFATLLGMLCEAFS